MDNIKSQFKYYALVNGETQLKTADISLEDYRKASNKGISFKQYVNSIGADADKRYGCAFNQAVQEMGAATVQHGRKSSMSPTLAQIYAGLEAGPVTAGTNVNAQVVTAPDGGNTTPAGRIFYPEILMDIMRETLNVDNSDIETGFDRMIAVRENIAGSIYIQPTINVKAPEASANQPIGQGADTPTIVGISTAQSSRTIPTKSIGLEITDQAMQYTTIDLVATILAAQSKGERARIVDADLNNIITGDVDSAMSALTSKKLNTYDSNITSNGQVTHLAFLKMLHEDYQKMSIDSAIMDIDTYYAFENRDNRPTVDKNAGTDGRLDGKFNTVNFSLSDFNVMIVDSAVLGGTNKALFLDSRYALRRVVDVTAQYEAIQSFVMRRINQMRFDYGFHTTRLHDEAFKLIDLSV